jgi:DNA primase
LIDRNFDPLDENFCWSPAAGFVDRVIIPFKYQGVVVGSTARKVTAGSPKYISDQHPFFVFNVDAQQDSSKYLFVCEGPFDALSVGGVALLTNEISDQQSRIINSLGKEVIVIPDQDQAGTMLIKQSIENGWSVAFPNWDQEIKDAADAVKQYGKLFVIVDAINTAQKGAIKINVALNNLENKIKIQSEREGI